MAGVVLITVLIVRGGPSDGHTVSVTVPDATNVVDGQLIRMAGRQVGAVQSIDPVDGGSAVRLRLRLDDAAWPLPRNSHFLLRWGGTISYDNRYVALTRGSGASIPDDGTLASKQFTSPVEFDQFVGTFTPKVREDIHRAVINGGLTLTAARPALQRTLQKTPPALVQANAVMAQLADSRRQLDVLLGAGSRVVGAARAAEPDVRQLVTGAATTFQTVAAESTNVKRTLTDAAPTLDGVRATLDHADGTLKRAEAVSARVAPGVQELRQVAKPLNSVLVRVEEVGPGATDTVATLRRASPSLRALLGRVKTLAPTVTSIGTQASRQLTCIRPYTPEITAFFSNWGGFFSASDGRDKYLRAQVNQLLPAMVNASPLTTGETKKLFPGLAYGLATPPGTAADQPWFLPECGAGPDALDPDKDPEARPYDQAPATSSRSKGGR